MDFEVGDRINYHEKTAPMWKQGMGSFACWNRLSYSLLWMRSPDHGAEKACREKHEKY